MKQFLLVLSALSFSLSSLAQFAIGSRTITFTDPTRGNRQVPCDVYYPATSSGSNAPVANGIFPVVVLGHGFAMTVNAYENWWTEFVPEGYIFVLPDTEIGTIFPPPDHEDFGLDLAFAAAEMQELNLDQGSSFFGKIAAKTALMGHSMGGGCSFLGAENNSLIDCVLGLAPAETNTSAIDAAANVTAPTLILWGTEDEVTPEADHALAIYNNLASNCKTYVRIDEGAHCFFANYNFFCATGEMNIGTLSREGQQEVSYALARPFFNYFLKDECSAYDDLQTEIATNPDLGTNILSCPNDAPVIVENGGVLESDVQSSYQWYLNGTEIPGADQQTFTYSGSGIYQVATINVGNCPVFSNEINVQITGVPEIELTLENNIQGSIQVRSSSILTNAEASWFDVSGRLLHTQMLQSSGGVYTIQKPPFTGIKLLQIRSEETATVFKIY